MRALEFWFAAPPAWVEIAGYILVALVGLQMLVGYRKGLTRRLAFRRTHFAIGWAIAVIMALHALVGVTHSVAGYLLAKG